MSAWFRTLTLLLMSIAAMHTAQAQTPQRESLVLGGGCFWCLEAVYDQVRGVESAVSGYAGGEVPNPTYKQVTGGRTGHAEVVEITFDPSVVSRDTLLDVFFTIHDPTTLNRQGNDVGPQYRSVIFYKDEKQKAAAKAFIMAIDMSKALNKPVATQLVPFTAFFEAEKYHQNYLRNNPKDPYIVTHDLPKLEALKQKFPSLYREKPSP